MDNGRVVALVSSLSSVLPICAQCSSSCALVHKKVHHHRVVQRLLILFGRHPLVKQLTRGLLFSPCVRFYLSDMLLLSVVNVLSC